MLTWGGHPSPPRTPPPWSLLPRAGTPLPATPCLTPRGRPQGTRERPTQEPTMSQPGQRHVITEFNELRGVEDEVNVLCGLTLNIRKGLVDPDDEVTHRGKTACTTCTMKADEDQLKALQEVCDEVPLDVRDD